MEHPLPFTSKIQLYKKMEDKVNRFFLDGFWCTLYVQIHAKSSEYLLMFGVFFFPVGDGDPNIF